MVNTEINRGGAARIARTLHEKLNADPAGRYRSLFLYGRGAADIRQARRITSGIEVYIGAGLFRLLGSEWVLTRRPVSILTRHVSQFDIVHLHNLHGYYLDPRLLLREMAKKPETPVVWTLHDFWIATGRCGYPRDCERWLSGCGECPYKSSYPRALLDWSARAHRAKKQLLEQMRDQVCFVSPSEWLKSELQRGYLRNFRVEVIPNAVDTTRFTPENKIYARRVLGLAEDVKIILFVAADPADERKGFRFLVEASRQIEHPAIIVVAGGEVPQAYSQELGLPIRSVGSVRDLKALNLVYNSADVFVVPSLEDNFPTTVLEAMSAGTPIVAFDCGGIVEQLRNRSGLLVRTGDSRELAEAITKVLVDETVRNELSVRARARAVREYSLDRFVQRYKSLYDDALNSLSKAK